MKSRVSSQNINKNLNRKTNNTQLILYIFNNKVICEDLHLILFWDYFYYGIIFYNNGQLKAGHVIIKAASQKYLNNLV